MTYLTETEYENMFRDAMEREFWDATEPDWQEKSGDPERFVSEHDYYAPTPEEVAGLALTDRINAHWDKYHTILV